jgi:hypothetical protein
MAHSMENIKLHITPHIVKKVSQKVDKDDQCRILDMSICQKKGGKILRQCTFQRHTQ